MIVIVHDLVDVLLDEVDDLVLHERTILMQMVMGMVGAHQVCNHVVLHSFLLEREQMVQ